MGKKPVRAVGSVQGDPDLYVAADGSITLVLGPTLDNQGARFRIANVNREILWAEDDQSHVFESELNGSPVFVFKIGLEQLKIPESGAILHVRNGLTDREFILQKNYSLFDPDIPAVDDGCPVILEVVQEDTWEVYQEN